MQIVFKAPGLPKIPLTRGSKRKRIFQEDEYTDFTISTLNYLTK